MPINPAEASQVTFYDQEFRKNSGFYFTKDGAEHKKAEIKVLLKTSATAEETVLVS